MCVIAVDVVPTHVWELGAHSCPSATGRRRAHACVGVGSGRGRTQIDALSCPRMCGSWAHAHAGGVPTGVVPTHVWELGECPAARWTSAGRAHACVGVGEATDLSVADAMSCPRMCGSWDRRRYAARLSFVVPTHVWELGSRRVADGPRLGRAHVCVGVGDTRRDAAQEAASCPRMCGSWDCQPSAPSRCTVVSTHVWELGSADGRDSEVQGGDHMSHCQAYRRPLSTPRAQG